MNKTLISIALAGCLYGAAAATPSTLHVDTSQREAFGIKTVQVEAGTQSLSKSYPAKVAVPNTQLHVISAPLEGVVESLLVAEGEQVQARQPLARLHSQGLLDLQAAYLESRTRLQLARESLERDRQLHKEGIVARRRLLESEAAYREAATAGARNRQALQLAGMHEQAIRKLASTQQLSTLLEVVAPIDGVVLEQIATAGQRLAASDPLYRVGDLSTLWIEVHVPLKVLGDTHPGSRIVLEDGLEAEVITVGRMVHGADQGILVRAALVEHADRLRPGQFTQAQLSRNQAEAALRVPARALLRIDGENRLFVQRDQGFSVVPVNVVAHEGESVVVRGGLRTDDRVVVDGTASLKAMLNAGAE